MWARMVAPGRWARKASSSSWWLATIRLSLNTRITAASSSLLQWRLEGLEGSGHLATSSTAQPTAGRSTARYSLNSTFS